MELMYLVRSICEVGDTQRWVYWRRMASMSCCSVLTGVVLDLELTLEAMYLRGTLRHGTLWIATVFEACAGVEGPR